jgi:hypothetical protein
MFRVFHWLVHLLVVPKMPALAVLMGTDQRHLEFLRIHSGQNQLQAHRSTTSPSKISLFYLGLNSISTDYRTITPNGIVAFFPVSWYNGHVFEVMLPCEQNPRRAKVSLVGQGSQDRTLPTMLDQSNLI